jgi:hypothetical protein
MGVRSLKSECGLRWPRGAIATSDRIAALDRQSGRMTATLNDANGAFVLFRSGTPL